MKTQQTHEALAEIVAEMENYPHIEATFHTGDRAPGIFAEGVAREKVDDWKDRLAALSSPPEHRACPCLHTTPCHPRCTCAQPLSSHGCHRCCSYGSPEQQKQKAEHLAAVLSSPLQQPEGVVHHPNCEVAFATCTCEQEKEKDKP